MLTFVLFSRSTKDKSYFSIYVRRVVGLFAMESYNIVVGCQTQGISLCSVQYFNFQWDTYNVLERVHTNRHERFSLCTVHPGKIHQFKLFTWWTPTQFEVCIQEEWERNVLERLIFHKILGQYKSEILLRVAFSCVARCYRRPHWFRVEKLNRVKCG